MGLRKEIEAGTLSLDATSTPRFRFEFLCDGANVGVSSIRSEKDGVIAIRKGWPRGDRPHGAADLDCAHTAATFEIREPFEKDGVALREDAVRFKAGRVSISAPEVIDGVEWRTLRLSRLSDLRDVGAAGSAAQNA